MVPAVPAPPASFFCTTVTSSSVIGLPVALSMANGCARRATFSLGTTNAVSAILSGPKRRSVRNAPSVIPETFSTTRPSTSVERLYSHIVPGWCASGACASRWICSVGVTSRQSTPIFPYAAFTSSFIVLLA